MKKSLLLETENLTVKIYKSLKTFFFNICSTSVYDFFLFYNFKYILLVCKLIRK